MFCVLAGQRRRGGVKKKKPAQDLYKILVMGWAELRKPRLNVRCFVCSQTKGREKKEHLYKIWSYVERSWTTWQDLTWDVLCVHRPEEGRRRSTRTRPVQDGRQDRTCNVSCVHRPEGERRKSTCIQDLYKMGWGRQDLTCGVLWVHRPYGERGKSTCTRSWRWVGRGKTWRAMYCVFTGLRGREEGAPIQDLYKMGSKTERAILHVCSQAGGGEKMEHLFKTSTRWETRLNVQCFVCSQAGWGEKMEHLFKTSTRWETRLNVQCFVCSQAGWGEKREHLFKTCTRRETRLNVQYCVRGSTCLRPVQEGKRDWTCNIV